MGHILHLGFPWIPYKLKTEQLDDLQLPPHWASRAVRQDPVRLFRAEASRAVHSFVPEAEALGVIDAIGAMKTPPRYIDKNIYSVTVYKYI